MNSYFSSTLFRKTLAALSGLFLVIFLIGHLIGNLQLILLSGEAAQKQFNEYALFMTTNPAVKILSIVILPFFSARFPGNVFGRFLFITGVGSAVLGRSGTRDFLRPPTGS